MSTTESGSPRRQLPEGVATMAPGAELGQLLDGVDIDSLSSSQIYIALAARLRQVSYEQARLLSWTLSAARHGYHDDECRRAGDCGCVVTRSPADGFDEFAADQIAFHLSWSSGAAEAYLEIADQLICCYPQVYSALIVGRIDLTKARMYCSALSRVDASVAGKVIDVTLSKAPKWTSGQLTQRLRYWVCKLDPDNAAERTRIGVVARRVYTRMDDDGTVTLAGQGLAPHRAAAARNRLQRLARAAKAAGDPRTLGQLETDAMLDLLTGAPFQTVPRTDPFTDAADASDRATSFPRCDNEPRPTVAATLAALRQQSPARRHGRRFAGAVGETKARCGPAPDADPSGPDSGSAAVAWDPNWPSDPPDDLDPGDGFVYSEPPMDEPFGAAGFFGEPLPPTTPDGRIDLTRVATPDRGDLCVCGGIVAGNRRGIVDIQLTLPTLLGLADDPAHLVGQGTIVADIARQVAADITAQWRYSLLDPDGTLIRQGTVRRRPTTNQASFVKARDKTCRAPGCRRPAHLCDGDHITAWANGGPTTTSNIVTLCRHHHRLKHQRRFVIRCVKAGTYEWWAPNGLRYRVDPEHTLDLDAGDVRRPHMTVLRRARRLLSTRKQ